MNYQDFLIGSQGFAMPANALFVIDASLRKFASRELRIRLMEPLDPARSNSGIASRMPARIGDHRMHAMTSADDAGASLERTEGESWDTDDVIVLRDLLCCVEMPCDMAVARGRLSKHRVSRLNAVIAVARAKGLIRKVRARDVEGNSFGAQLVGLTAQGQRLLSIFR